MTYKIAIYNAIGGPGKTTVTKELAAALAETGDKVLVIDLDAQGHLTKSVGKRNLYLQKSPNLYHCLLAEGSHTLRDLLYALDNERFTLLPSNYQMLLAEQALTPLRGREWVLRERLKQLENEFDWILMDCPPYLGIVSDNALAASQRTIIPVETDEKSVEALELLLDQIESLENALSITVEVLAIVPNKTRPTKVSVEVLDEFRELSQVVTPFTLPRREIYQNAWRENRTVFAYEPTSHDQKKAKLEVMEDYKNLAQLVIKKVKELTYD